MRVTQNDRKETSRKKSEKEFKDIIMHLAYVHQVGTKEKDTNSPTNSNWESNLARKRLEEVIVFKKENTRHTRLNPKTE